MRDRRAATLQKLPSLSDFLARARKYGGCGILGFQSYPQLEATYGIQDAAAITGYCSTWVALRANDTPTAKPVSENLGQVEQVEANEGMSYGVNDMRDGVNLSRMQVIRPLVMHTEVTNLPNLAGYLRFGRSLPVVRFEDRYNKLPSIAVAFEERTEAALRIDLTDPQEVPKPAAPKPKATPPRTRKPTAKDPGPELLLEPPAHSASAGEIKPAGPKPPPETRLLGKPSGFSLQQHGRRGGDRDEAKPA